MTPRDHVLIDYVDLREGESKSGQLCPACNGGQSGESSLSVSRIGDSLRWNCHRSSCAFRGVSDLSSAYGGSSTGNQTSKPASYIPTTPIDTATAKFLATAFGLTREVVDFAGLRWTGEDGGHYARRIAFPIYGPDTRQRGQSYRSFEGAKPKAIIKLRSEDDIAACWYKYRRASKTLVIVEDQLSALRMCPHVHSLALLGTNLNESKVEEIKVEKFEHVILSLDNDATKEAIKLQLKWREALPMCVHGLHKDIKNMNESEFQTYLTGVLPV